MLPKDQADAAAKALWNRGEKPQFSIELREPSQLWLLWGQLNEEQRLAIVRELEKQAYPCQTACVLTHDEGRARGCFPC